jgi:DNA-binding SARP family transcriptional activator
MAVLAAGQLERADRLLATCGRIRACAPESLTGGLWHIAASWRARFDGRYGAGLQHAEEALRVAMRSEARMPQTWCQYTLAHACLDCGDAGRAAREAETALSLARETGIRSVEIWVKLLQARIALLQGDEQAGLGCLAEGLRHHDPSAYCLLVGWLPDHVSSLYATALEHGIQTEFVRKIIRQGTIAPPACALPPDAWPLPLKIYTLGRFSVHIDGRPLTFRGKSQKKPLELLKALIAFGGRSVREERLVEALWPEADGDLGARALTSALHRLRKLVGAAALTRKEGHLTLEARYCWVDKWPLDRRLGELENEVARTAQTDDLARGLGEVLSLYHGAFLEADGDRTWLLPVRERLRDRVINVLERVGERLLVEKDYGRALECFERALRIDPTRESSYRGVMRARTGRGERAEIVAAYERCRTVLSTEFGCGPSAETEALLRRIGVGSGMRQLRTL